mmetsp:Transcript_6500/g.15010  ORF Transcript_6500/g.15010 Transcript_6500/m.15010 type:complete len:206 (+) Transcript_6500:889-1506(+)
MSYPHDMTRARVSTYLTKNANQERSVFELGSLCRHLSYGERDCIGPHRCVVFLDAHTRRYASFSPRPWALQPLVAPGACTPLDLASQLLWSCLLASGPTCRNCHHDCYYDLLFYWLSQDDSCRVPASMPYVCRELQHSAASCDHAQTTRHVASILQECRSSLAPAPPWTEWCPRSGGRNRREPTSPHQRNCTHSSSSKYTVVSLY